MTDNAFAYTKNRSLRALLHRRAMNHLRTRPYTPRTNGKVERSRVLLGMGDTGLEPVTSALSRRRSPS